MEQSSNDDHIENVVVKIDDLNASSSSSGTQFDDLYKKSKVSFEQVLEEAVQRRNRDVPRTSSFHDDLYEDSSWRLLVKKTKSRLIDLPENHYQFNESANSIEDDSNNDNEVIDIPDESRAWKCNCISVIQSISLVTVSVIFCFSLLIPSLKAKTLLHLPLWKWELLVMTLICGHLFSGLGIKIVVFFMERHFLLRKRVLYFVYGLKKAVRNCLWLGLVLLVWHFIFDPNDEEQTKSQILPYATKILICLFVGTLIWLFKTLLVKVLANSFHVSRFFDRIQDALFNQYVIEALSGPPSFTTKNRIDNEEEQGTSDNNLNQPLLEKNSSKNLQRCRSVGLKSRFSRKISKNEVEEISMDDLHKLNQKNISAWNMRRMINIIQHGALCTLDEQILNSDMKDESKFQINSEWQAKEAAKKIFNNVAQPGSQYIYFEDLIRFITKNEAIKAFHDLFGISCRNVGITKAALNALLVNSFRERKAIALSLNDTKTAVDELHNLLNMIVAVIIFIVWLIILGFPIYNILVFISSQLLLVVFIFGNTCKTTFEAIIFLFVMHPYDVGDFCEIDGEQMVVEEMNILSTVFLRANQQKIVYPNSLLATKPIGNFHRSPDMGETINFCIHISTPTEKIASMKDKIKGYIKEKEEHWHTDATVMLTDIEDTNKLNIAVWAKHRSNYQNGKERWARRSLLLEEIIKILKELEIEYRLLPLDVNIRHVSSLASDRVPSNWTTPFSR